MSASKSLSVTVITVNYNEKEMTKHLISSLRDQQDIHMDIWVVDNSDDPAGRMKKGKGFKIIHMENRGYAAALNSGIRHSYGSPVLLVNNDIEFPPGSLKCLLRSLEENPQYGAVSPVIRNTGTGLIEFTGFSAISSVTGRNRSFTRTIDQDIRATPYLHGACMLVKRETIDRTDLLPEIYFLYYEEMEWSVRMRNAGILLGASQKCQVNHHKSVSTAKTGSGYYYLQRNRILFQRRNSHGIRKVMFYLYLFLVSVPVNLLRNTASGRRDCLHSYLRAVRWNLTNKNSIDGTV